MIPPAAFEPSPEPSENGSAKYCDAIDCGKGRIVVVRHAEGHDSTTRREEGFLSALRGHPGVVVLHELAHVIGLGHVESRTSIMNEALTQQTLSSSEWGVGDLIGLRQLGREGGCVTVPTVPLQGAPR